MMTREADKTQWETYDNLQTYYAIQVRDFLKKFGFSEFVESIHGAELIEFSKTYPEFKKGIQYSL